MCGLVRGIKRVKNWFFKDRENTSFQIIFPKILFSAASILMVYRYIFLFNKFVTAVCVEEKILRLSIAGWLLTSVRSWWFNRTAKRLSYCDEEFRQKVKRWGKRNYGDLIPIYLINYPILILSIYFIVTEIFPLIFNKALTNIQMYIFAFILGYMIDGIWEVFKRFPEIFTRR